MEIKPSLGDGHCLLYSVCASSNNQLTYLDSINKSSLITTATDEVHGNTDAYLVFSKLRVAMQQYSTLLRTTRNSYYNNVLRDADCKAVHKIAAELMGGHTAMPGPECPDDAELATKFSSYFKDKISDIYKSLPPPPPPPQGHRTPPFCIPNDRPGTYHSCRS